MPMIDAPLLYAKITSDSLFVVPETELDTLVASRVRYRRHSSRKIDFIRMLRKRTMIISVTGQIIIVGSAQSEVLAV